MRFSIRDLIWLTAVVALAATVYTDRIRVQRLARQWAEERAAVERDTEEAIAEMQGKVNGMRAAILMQEHRFNVQLEDERRRHQREVERARADAIAEHTRHLQAAASATRIELAIERDAALPLDEASPN
jgi:hypothetical protein